MLVRQLQAGSKLTFHTSEGVITIYCNIGSTKFPFKLGMDVPKEIKIHIEEPSRIHSLPPHRNNGTTVAL